MNDRNGPMHGEHGRHDLPFWGLLAFAIWSPLSIAGANIAWVTTLFLWGFQVVRERKTAGLFLKRTALDEGFALLLLASLLSLCVSLDPLASLKEFRSLGLIAVYYLFAWNVKTRQEARILLACWLAACTLAAAYGAVEYCTGQDWFGHYDPRSNKIGGFFSMHLTFSEYLLLALCMSAGVLLWDRPAGRRGRACLWAAFSILLFGFLLARAKGAYLGLLAGMAVICALKGRRALVWMGALVLAPLLLLAAWNAEYLYTHFLSQFLIDADPAAGYVHSNTQRLFMWWTGFRISAGHFLNGVGMHAVEAIYPAFRHVLARDPNQWHLHSNFIQLGVEGGLFGLCGFLVLFLLACRNGFARLRGRADPWERALAGGALGVLTSFLVSGLTEFSWGDSEVLMALYMVLGLSVSVPAAPEGKERANPGPGKGSALLPACFSGLLALVCLASLVLPALQVNTGTRVLEAVLGLSLCGTAVASLLLRRLAPWKQENGPPHHEVDRSTPGKGMSKTCHGLFSHGECREETKATRQPPGAETCSCQGTAEGSPQPSGGQAEGLCSVLPGRFLSDRLSAWLLSPVYPKAVACIVTLAGYGATRHLWVVAEQGGNGSGLGRAALLALVVACFAGFGFFVGSRGSGISWGLFDTAFVGSAGVWAFLALGTGALLRLASGSQGPLDPPFPCVYLLCSFVVCLYVSTRFLYCRGRFPDLLTAALGLSMAAHALKGL